MHLLSAEVKRCPMDSGIINTLWQPSFFERVYMGVQASILSEDGKILIAIIRHFREANIWELEGGWTLVIISESILVLV